MLNITQIDLTEDTNEDPFKFVSKILEMDLEVLKEIFPETGSVENIFKYYTYREAKDRFDKWYNK